MTKSLVYDIAVSIPQVVGTVATYNSEIDVRVYWNQFQYRKR